MKRSVLMVVLLFGLSAMAQQAGPPPDFEIPTNLKPYFVVFYVANPNSAKAHENHELTKKHLQFIRSLAESGKIAVAGPFTEEGKFAGMFILSAASSEEAKKLLSSDPLVSTGAVDVEVHSAMLEDLSSVKFVYPEKKSP